MTQTLVGATEAGSQTPPHARAGSGSVDPSSTRAILDGLANSSAEMSKLARKLHARHPMRGEHDINDALQHAFAAAYSTCQVRHEGKAYAWLATVANVYLIELHRRECRELPTDNDAPIFEATPDKADNDPARALSQSDERAELRRLRTTIEQHLTPRQRRVLAARLSDIKISHRDLAAALDTSERTLKKDVQRINEVGRQHVIARAGRGCGQSDTVVARYAFGIAKPGEARRAQLHLAGCASCGTFFQALERWRDKAAAFLPVAGCDPGGIERACHKVVELTNAVRQHIGDGADHARRHAETNYATQAERFPRLAETASKLSIVRPGHVAAAVAVCAFGASGAAKECVDVGARLFDPVAKVVQTSDRRPPPKQKRPQVAPASQYGSSPGPSAQAAVATPPPVDHMPAHEVNVDQAPERRREPTQRQKQAAGAAAARNEFDPAAAAAQEQAGGTATSPTTAQAAEATSPASTPSAGTPTTSAKPVPNEEAGIGYIGGP